MPNPQATINTLTAIATDSPDALLQVLAEDWLAVASFISEERDRGHMLDQEHARWKSRALTTEDERDLNRRHAEALGLTIVGSAVKAGIYNGDAPIGGPHLIQLCADMADDLIRNREYAELAAEELRNIALAKRYDREHFSDDTEFADWAQSRARHTLGKLPAKSENEIGQAKDRAGGHYISSPDSGEHLARAVQAAMPQNESAIGNTNGWHRIATIEDAVLWKCPNCKRETWATERAPDACACLSQSQAETLYDPGVAVNGLCLNCGRPESEHYIPDVSLTCPAQSKVQP